MSQATTATVPTTPPSILKNTYFTYVAGSDGKDHRATTQVWNVAYDANSVAIYVQGDVTGKGFPAEIKGTYFAKKHLLTFKGGKAATGGGDITAKMQRYADKRQFKLTKSQLKGNTPMTADQQRIVTKYSPTPAKKGSTLIVCDNIPVDDLKLLFAKALSTTTTPGEAHLLLPVDAVWFCKDGSATPEPIDGATDKDVVSIAIGFAKSSGGSFVVIHCGDATKV